MSSNRNIHVGVDIGGTNIKFGIAGNANKLLLKDKIATEPEKGTEAIIKSIAVTIERLLKQLNLNVNDLESIGIGVPGTTDNKKGLVVFAPNLFWKNFQLVQELRKYFSMPIYIAQDTRAAAWAEYLTGTAKGLKNIACVTIGTGIGCGMIIDGKIYHGGMNTAGEFGHQIIDINGNKCNCGRYGCLEAHASGLAIIKDAIAGGLSTESSVSGAENLQVHHIFELAEAGNPVAKNIVDKLPAIIGTGLVNLINLFSPEMVVLSGGISQASDALLFNPILTFIKERAYPSVSETVIIRKSILADDAPMIGATLLFKAFKG